MEVSVASRSSSPPPLRAGGTALTLLSSSLNLEVLRNLAEGPQRLQSLMRNLGFPPRSTMRLYLRTLVEMGAVKQRRRSEFPVSVEYEITVAGRALLAVSETLRTWLQDSPTGSTELGSTAARSAVKAVVEGWSSNVIRALAERPLPLTELNGLIPQISYPSLERRLTAMRQVDLLEVQATPGRTTPYGVTKWLRKAVVPVASAVDWERTFAANLTPEPRRLDVEAAFLLAIPLVALDRDLTGTCRLAVEMHDGTSPAFAGVSVAIKNGKVTGCAPRLDGDATAWASGKLLAWLRRMKGVPLDEFEIGGEGQLAEALAKILEGTSDKLH